MIPLPYFEVILLFTTTILSGSLVFIFPNKIVAHSRLFLIFGGTFLFSLTLVDVLPTLYAFSNDHHSLAYCLLIGFFSQFFLDLLSHGIAHGHPQNGQKLGLLSSFALLSALFIHAMFDGFLVSGTDCGLMGRDSHHHGLLQGVLLHKIPVTFSFVAILLQKKHRAWVVASYLLCFALASPLGCFLSFFLQSGSEFLQQCFMICWALAVGNLMHIATTILLEANSDHDFSMINFLVHLAGIFLAVMATL